jgi:Zn-dependent protease with chaperone function
MHLIGQIRRRPHVAFSVLCLITVSSGYVGTCTNSTIGKLIAIVLLCLSVVIWAYFCLRQIVAMLKMRVSRKYPSSYELPDYESMQKLVGKMRVKLDKKHPFVLKLGLDNAYYDHWKDRIVLGEVLVQRLESQERMALVGHELTHVKKGHLVKEILILPFIAIVITILLLHRDPDSVFCAVCIALFLVLFPYVSRRFEYEADAGAAHETSPAATVSLLKKTEVEER